MAAISQTVTILFTDLVNSTELMQRAGDEDAQRIFKAHYQVLREAVAANGGAEVKSLGDGLMVAFNAAADAVRCAINMQQASRRAVSGEHLAIRVGLNVGDALRDEGDLFGTPVVVARRLCDSAAAGQIRASAAVAHVLAGRQAFSFRDLGALELKGITEPVPACEVVFERDEPNALLARTPFVGRSVEVARLRTRFEDAKAGRGGLVMLVGEPGIGKTRTSDEFAEWVEASGGRVLRGRCFEGDWAPPYGPFGEAIERYARDADVDELREDLGTGAGPIARLVPALREPLGDLPEPETLKPDEERFRLLDAVAQFLHRACVRAPLVLFLDDLHWADQGTITMMRHVARGSAAHRLLVLGAYRDVELDRQHPLADALSALRREVEYERILLKGLDADEVGTLLSTLAEQDVNAALVQAISEETDGNPFFIREVLAHLVEDGKLYREDGQWKSTATTIADLGIPEGVRQVITRRLSRLSADANKIMTAASAFNGGFNFVTLSLVTGLDEGATLDAIDEALDAQLLRPTGQLDHYDFMHALIRHTLYSEMNPSRQVRLHRQIAEAYEQRNQDQAAKERHAAEIAYQFHRSAAIPGAERGVEYALLAADRAEAAYAHDEVEQFLRIAVDLLPEHDARKPRTLARFAVALAWTLCFDESLSVAIDAGGLIALAEGRPQAADFLADSANALSNAGSLRGAWELAAVGVSYAVRGSATWSRLTYLDIQRREAANPDTAGTSVPLDAPELDELVEVVRSLPAGARPMFLSRDRTEALEAGGPTIIAGGFALPAFNRAFPLGFQAGEFRRARDLFQQAAVDSEAGGRIAEAAGANAMLARCHNALGDLDIAQAVYDHSLALAAKLAGDPLLGAQSIPAQQVVAALDELRLARGTTGVAESVALVRGLISQSQPEFQWARSSVDAGGARILAIAGHTEESLTALEALSRRLDRIPAWDPNITRVLSDAARALWTLERTDHLETIERNLRSKVIEPDFRYPMFDGRLAMAQLCALTGCFDEAIAWFAKARAVLDEQGARPLRAIVDYDEALMYARRREDGDASRARPLLDVALRQFEEIGMTGWTARGEALRSGLRQMG
jgi:class 3 adenylate cyclase/tetratricopeptide (TPR) repeat protein